MAEDPRGQRTSSRVTVTQLLGGPELSPGTPPDEAGRGQQITLAWPLQVSQGATVLELSYLVPSRERCFCPYCRGSRPMLAPPLRPKPTLRVS
ncbi:unnamed protein product [Rangifer tarandus platyrhynchus]|uniref:Uncharacterized protein n=1 Tax=Rangifer tarandus platyrhynchus TaxID=3082113 RepID=A0ABN8XWR1_RANTA|nr:unnamed protein product [Rangifer tarandus platyrhynchus]